MWSGLSFTTGHLMSKCTNAPNLILTSQLARYPVKWERRERVRATFRNKFELVHMDTWRIIKWRKSTSNWITNCLQSGRLTNKLAQLSIWSAALSTMLCTLDMSSHTNNVVHQLYVIPYQQYCTSIMSSHINNVVYQWHVIPYNQCCTSMIGHLLSTMFYTNDMSHPLSTMFYTNDMCHPLSTMLYSLGMCHPCQQCYTFVIPYQEWFTHLIRVIPSLRNNKTIYTQHIVVVI